MIFQNGEILYAEQLNSIIKPTASAAYRLIDKMRCGRENVCVIANSDSTGITGDTDGSVFYNKWIYKIAGYLGTMFPDYTVLYYDVVPAFYNLPQTLQTGKQKVSTAVVAAGGSGYVVGDNIYLSGGVTLKVSAVSSGAVTGVTIAAVGNVASTDTPTNPVSQTGTSGTGTGATFTLTWVSGLTLYFYNAAFAGTQPTYLMGVRLQSVYNPRTADLIIYNHGHNTDGNSSPNVQQGMNMAAIYTILGFHPNAGVLVVSQNPIRDDNSGTNRSVGAVQTAIEGGFSLLPVHQMFLQAGKPDSWYRTIPNTGAVDNIHPSAIGDQKIFELAKPLFEWPLSPVTKKEGFDIATNLLQNPSFKDWTSDVPASWVSKDLTLTKNTTAGQFESNAYSLQMLTTTTTGGVLSQELPANIVRAIAGRTVTLAARVYIPASNTLSNAARIRIAEIDGTAPYGIPTGGRDGWIWKAVVIQVPVNATTLTVQLLADAAGNAAGSTCNFDRVILSIGNIPKDSLS